MTKLLQKRYKRKAELEELIDSLDIEWENLRDEMDGTTSSSTLRAIDIRMLECDNEKEEAQEELDELKWDIEDAEDEL